MNEQIIEHNNQKPAESPRPDNTLRVNFTIEAVGAGRKVIDLQNVVFEISEFCSPGNFDGKDVFQTTFDLLVKRPAEKAISRFLQELTDECFKKYRAQAAGSEDRGRTFADVNAPHDTPGAGEDRKLKAA